MRRFALVPALALLAACGEMAMEPSPSTDELAPEPSLSALADGIVMNATDGGAEYFLYKAEYLTSGEDGRLGRTVFFRDVGNKWMDSHWVPGDPRRSWRDPGGGLTYAVDGTEGSTASGLAQSETDGAIRRAMHTWDAVRCSTIPLVDLGNAPFDVGFAQLLLGAGGAPWIVADVVHGGWLPGAFFDLVEPGGSAFILGVTFTFSWLDGAGEPTDVDNNRRLDTALTETYYNDAFPWNIGDHFDVETIALHETGHALSQWHFGKAFGTDRNGKIHFAPRALMNQAYSGIQTRVLKSDNAGHCSIWAAW